MTVHVLLGIGGTGAKVTESVIHATAAGLGPKKLLVGFIDQDQSNGNTTRARQLVTTIDRARRQWRGIGNPHFIQDGGPLQADIDFFDSADGLWTPHADQATTLRSVFGNLGPDQAALDVFFLPDDTEQDMPLDGGYKARPYIGSAAITAAIGEGRDPFWHAFDQLIGRAAAGEEVRLLLTGSVFGGTGAAGFPTIARLIRTKIENTGRTMNFRMSGVLMLPYFGFAPPSPEATGQAANVARSDKLLLQSRGALRYYDALMREQHVFDDLYLVGWNRPMMLNYHAPEKDAQRNPALLPELVAAMGACRFLVNGTDAGTDRIHICARAQDSSFNWADLPSPDLGDAGAGYKALGQALRFAVAWKHYAPLIGQRPSGLRKLFGGHPFYRRQRLHRVDYQQGGVDAAISAMTAYVDALLSWAASIQTYAESSGVAFSLWDVGRTVQPIDARHPEVLPIPRSSIDGDQAMRDAYQAAVNAPPGAEEPPGSHDLLTSLTNEAAPGTHTGLGQMLASLHAGTAIVGPES